MNRPVRWLLVASIALSGCGGFVTEPRVDASGDIAIRVDGEPVDLSEERYQAEHASNSSHAFHLHENDTSWYMEGRERVTVAQALDYLPHVGYSNASGGAVVTIDGTTYDESTTGTAIDVTVNDTSVEPQSYKLQDNDDVVVEIRSSR